MHPGGKVAAELSVIESRVSQLRTEALAPLNDGLPKYLEQRDTGIVKGDGCVPGAGRRMRRRTPLAA